MTEADIMPTTTCYYFLELTPMLRPYVFSLLVTIFFVNFIA